MCSTAHGFKCSCDAAHTLRTNNPARRHSLDLSTQSRWQESSHGAEHWSVETRATKGSTNYTSRAARPHNVVGVYGNTITPMCYMIIHYSTTKWHDCMHGASSRPKSCWLCAFALLHTCSSSF